MLCLGPVQSFIRPPGKKNFCEKREDSFPHIPKTPTSNHEAAEINFHTIRARSVWRELKCTPSVRPELLVAEINASTAQHTGNEQYFNENYCARFLQTKCIYRELSSGFPHSNCRNQMSPMCSDIISKATNLSSSCMKKQQGKPSPPRTVNICNPRTHQ